jgi:diketogulonate reductase-like aldo/keto reductase
MMGERAGRRKDEIASLKVGIDLGLTLIDTAEMYADGGAEEIVAEAVAGRRDQVFILSKVLPSNASTKGVIAACERSLKRLRADCIDLYLLHWPGNVPFRETLAGFERLMRDGKIRSWGVSNFDAGEMADVVRLAGGDKVATNQVLYNLGRRGPEYDLVPWCRAHRVPIMAYSPLDQGRLLKNRTISEVAARRKATPAQVALAWLLAQDQTIVIPKSGNEPHTRENAGARDLRLTDEDYTALNRAFPPPGKKKPLEMI